MKKVLIVINLVHQDYIYRPTASEALVPKQNDYVIAVYDDNWFIAQVQTTELSNVDQFNSKPTVGWGDFGPNKNKTFYPSLFIVVCTNFNVLVIIL